jgi:phosphoribosylanthranilate isomerase
VLVTTAVELTAVVELAGFVQPGVVQLHGSGGVRLMDDAKSALPGTELWHVVPLDVECEDAARDRARLRAEVEAAIAAGADKLLIDSARGGSAGGTGVTADWDVAAEVVELAGETPVILAGGLSATNIAEAVDRVRPAGVDVSSGVESAPGVKSPRLMRAFFGVVTVLT